MQFLATVKVNHPDRIFKENSFNSPLLSVKQVCEIRRMRIALMLKLNSAQLAFYCQFILSKIWICLFVNKQMKLKVTGFHCSSFYKTASIGAYDLSRDSTSNIFQSEPLFIKYSILDLNKSRSGWDDYKFREIETHLRVSRHQTTAHFCPIKIEMQIEMLYYCF